MRSLREAHLEMRARRLESARHAARPGQPDRSALLARYFAEENAHRAARRFAEDAAELRELDVFPLDPVRGLAGIPFLCDDQLAWYIFDLFDKSDALQTWRYDDDPADFRRPVTLRQKGVATTVRVG
jgi:hypothetical protein